MKKNFILLPLIIASLSGKANHWTQRADFADSGRYGACGFSIGDYGYIGLGYVTTGYVQDFWQYDPALNSWMQKANFPGNARWNSAGFAIGNHGYVSTGFSNYTFYSDLWDYDAIANTWTRRVDFPGKARWGAIGFSIGSKGYLGIGYNTGSGGGTYNDFWQYDTLTGSWTQMASYTGYSDYGIAIAIGNKGYVGLGLTSWPYSSKSFNEYDPVANAWNAKAEFPGSGRYGAAAFTIGNFAFVGTGRDGITAAVYNDFYRYDPSTDSWSSIDSLPATIRFCSAAFSIGNKGYIGTGADNNSNGLKDFWEYTPDSVTAVASFNHSASELQLYPNPVHQSLVINYQSVPDKSIKIMITDMQGKEVYTKISTTSSNDVADVSGFNNGIYIIEIKQGDKLAAAKFIKQ